MLITADIVFVVDVVGSGGVVVDDVMLDGVVVLVVNIAVVSVDVIVVIVVVGDVVVVVGFVGVRAFAGDVVAAVFNLVCVIDADVFDIVFSSC